MKTSKIQTRYGDMIVLTTDTTICHSLIEYGEWTHSEMRILEQVIRPGMTVLDIGANIGCHTLAFSKAVGANGRVLGLEPQPFLFRLLAANLVTNEVANVLALNAGAGKAPGWMDLPDITYHAPNNYGALKLDPFLADGEAEKKNIPIPVHRLDDLPFAQTAGVIKIDVEGMEPAVLEGARGIISRRRPVLFVENESPGAGSEALLGLLSTMNYDVYWQIAPLFEAANFRNNLQNIFLNRACVNVVAVPREREMQVNSMKKVESITEHPRKKIEAAMT
jgi:FkbM family methyltransferase